MTALYSTHLNNHMWEPRGQCIFLALMALPPVSWPQSTFEAACFTWFPSSQITIPCTKTLLMLLPLLWMPSLPWPCLTTSSDVGTSLHQTSRALFTSHLSLTPDLNVNSPGQEIDLLYLSFLGVKPNTQQAWENEMNWKRPRIQETVWGQRHFLVVALAAVYLVVLKWWHTDSLRTLHGKEGPHLGAGRQGLWGITFLNNNSSE